MPLIQTRKCFSSSLRLMVALLFLDLLLTSSPLLCGNIHQNGVTLYSMFNSRGMPRSGEILIFVQKGIEV